MTEINPAMMNPTRSRLASRAAVTRVARMGSAMPSIASTISEISRWWWCSACLAQGFPKRDSGLLDRCFSPV
jgi:hypothetical protein